MCEAFGRLVLHSLQAPSVSVPPSSFQSIPFLLCIRGYSWAYAKMGRHFAVAATASAAAPYCRFFRFFFFLSSLSFTEKYIRSQGASEHRKLHSNPMIHPDSLLLPLPLHIHHASLQSPDSPSQPTTPAFPPAPPNPHHFPPQNSYFPLRLHKSITESPDLGMRHAGANPE